MQTLPVSLPSNAYTIENLFSLAITQKITSTKIIMQSFSAYVNTAHLPTIVGVLKHYLPTVLRTQCHNDENLPFALEVKRTEIGHLFEHILLEYLCQLKIAKGHKRAVFSGRTKWNWIRDPRGKFHIHLTCGMKDADILPTAVEKTINLMKIILDTPALITNNYTAKNGLKNGRRLSKQR